jgi:hypothetical protein
VHRAPHERSTLSFRTLQPGVQVSGVCIRVVWDASFSQQKDAGQFGTQFLPGVVEISKAIAFVERLAFETIRMTSPVDQLVKCRPVVVRSCFEPRSGGKVDGIGTAAIERVVGLVVVDSSARGIENRLRTLKNFPFLADSGGRGMPSSCFALKPCRLVNEESR